MTQELLGWRGDIGGNPGALHVLRELPRSLLHRHLGMPAGAALEGPGADSLDAVLSWYAAHGEPWVGVTVRAISRIGAGRVDLAGFRSLSSQRLAARLREAEAHAVAVVAASVGPGVDEEVDRLWKDGRPDEAVFLSALAAAMTEHLRDATVERLAKDQAREGVLALPRYAPGYEGWALEDLANLAEALDDKGPLRVLASGGLVPLKSTLVLIGLTRRHDLSSVLLGFWDRDVPAHESPRPAGYSSPERALQKWSRERLQLTRTEDGVVRARFRFDGQTCTSLNRSFELDYDVELRREASGAYRLQGFSTRPAPGDKGLRWTCAFRESPELFLRAVEEPPPFAGKMLESVLEWQPDESPAACLCTAANRNHKWRIVLQTIHYALTRCQEGDLHDAKQV